MDADAKKVARKQVSLVSDYQNVFGSKQGRRVFLNLCYNAGLLEPFEESDSNKAFKRLGEQNLVIRIAKMLKYDVYSLIKEIEQEEQGNG